MIGRTAEALPGRRELRAVQLLCGVPDRPQTNRAVEGVPIHVIVTCTKAKHLSPDENLRAQNLPDAGRFREWADRLRHQADLLVPAIDLYAGEHWHIARSLCGLSDRPVRLWMISAGLGLISARATVPAYEATFSAGHADTVARGDVADAAAWWSLLGSTLPADAARPRSLRRMIARRRGDVLLCVSKPYLAAVAADLAAAVAASGAERWTIISAGSVGAALPPTVRGRLLPADGSLRQTVGGTMRALNVRLAAAVLRNLPADSNLYAHARGIVDQLRRSADQVVAAPPRRRLSDSEVSAFVRKHRGEGGHYVLLRLLRQSGLACEQRRFVRLCREAVPEKQGGANP